MGQALPVRADYTASEVRRFARRAKDGAQARFWRLRPVLDGASREEAAKIGGMDRQTLRDWVIRYNEQGPDGLINIPSPGAPPKLDATHKAFLRRLVDEGPIPAIHGVVRWRACDLIMRLHDAETICEAVTRTNMRFVETKTPELAWLHRTRHLFIRQQTAVINAIRAHLAAFGIVAPVGRQGVDELLKVVANPNDKRLPEVVRACVMGSRQPNCGC